MEEFVQEAIKRGFTSYGFSSHAPLPYHTRWNMDECNLSAYLSEFNRLKSLYSSKIELYLGLEIDFLTDDYNASSDLFTSLPLDYRIGSLHTIQSPDGELLEIDCSIEKFQHIVFDYFSGDVIKVTNLYIDRLMAMISTGHFDIVGHADKMHSLSDLIVPGLSSQSWYQKRMCEYFSLIAEKGYLVEMNTKKYLDKGLFFPDAQWYSFLHELGVRVVVNSDSHYTDKINNGRLQGLMLLKSSGYECVSELHNGQWTDVPIDTSF